MNGRGLHPPTRPLDWWLAPFSSKAFQRVQEQCVAVCTKRYRAGLIRVFDSSVTASAYVKSSKQTVEFFNRRTVQEFMTDTSISCTSRKCILTFELSGYHVGSATYIQVFGMLHRVYW